MNRIETCRKNKFEAASNIILALMTIFASFQKYYVAGIIITGGTAALLAIVFVINGYKYERIVRNIAILIMVYSMGVAYRLLALSSHMPHLRATMEKIGPNSSKIFIITSAISILMFIIFIKNRLQFIKNWFAVKAMTTDEGRISVKETVCIFVLTVFTITLVSQCSFLYVINEDSDANIFLTVGRGILYGKIPYADLYEAKGPILYFIYALAASVKSDGFLGIYYIEIISNFFFLFFSYKLIRLFSSNFSFYVFPIFVAVTYSSVTFLTGGSAEEFGAPFLLYSLYSGIRFVRSDDGNTFSSFEQIFIGICSGIVFWIKYLMVGFYIGWIIVPAILFVKKKHYGRLLKLIFLILSGVIIASIPVIAYFLYNGAVADLFGVYFYDNIFRYKVEESQGIPVISSLINIFQHFIYHDIMRNFLVTVLSLFGFLTVWKRNSYIFTFVTTCFLGLISFLYFRTAGLYYSFPVSAFASLGIVGICDVINPDNRPRKASFKALAYGLTCYLFILSFSINLLCIKKNYELPQYKFSKIICNEENPTLLTYGTSHAGFYTPCNIVPNCKYFTTYNRMTDFVMGEQNKYIKEGKIDYIVTSIKTDFDNYRLIDTASSFYMFEQRECTYYLYEKINR